MRKANCDPTHTRLMLACALILSGLALASRTSAAQQIDTTTQRRWLSGMSFGIPGYEGETIGEAFTVGGNWTYFKPYRPGPDISVVVAPRAFQFGALAGGLRVGGALPMPLTPGFAVVPSAGATLLAAVSTDGGGGVVGWNWGLAGVVTGDDGWGVRVGMSWHHLEAIDAKPVWLLELGFVRGPRGR